MTCNCIFYEKRHHRKKNKYAVEVYPPTGIGGRVVMRKTADLIY